MIGISSDSRRSGRAPARTGRRLARPAAAGVVATLIALVALAGCTSTTPRDDDDERVQVVVSFYPLQFVAEQVGGDDVAVTNLTPPGAGSHDLELRPSQIIDIWRADLVVYQSGFQPATDDAVRQNPPRHAVDATQRADLVDGDPHFWLDPTRLAAVATQVGEGLAAVDPDHAEEYVRRAEALTRQLGQLDTDYRRALERCRGATLVTSHTAFGYLAERYGLRQVGLRGVDPEVEPSPARLRDLSELIRATGVRTIYFEVLTGPEVTRALADDLDLDTAVLDPIENQTTPGQDYLDAMTTNRQALTDGLVCAAS